MGLKHLHELLREDQEPFLLNSYISDRSFLIGRRPAVKSRLQLKNQPPALRKSILSGIERKGSCFFSLPDSPEPRRSPMCVALQSPKRPNSFFLHVPEKTSALLLESALRIQRQRSSAQNKPAKPSVGLPGFRLFGSLLKRLTKRNWTEKAKQRSETSGCVFRGSEGEGRCSFSGFEAESSSDYEEGDEEDVGLESKAIYGGGTCLCCDEEFRESPFRFALQRSPPSGHRTPEITSPPASSPVRRDLKDKKDDAGPVGLQKSTVDGEEREEKEQCSPVCVLDPPFDDDVGDEDAHGHGDENNTGDFDYESSYAVVQRAKQELLRKLRRFEKLAELDPVELERRLIEQDGEEDDGANDEPELAGLQVEEVLRSSSQDQESTLAGDLLAEGVEKRSRFDVNRETVARWLCRGLQQWKEADFDRIDATVERDLRSDLHGWIERDGEQVAEAVEEIEAAIFGLMLEELAGGLACFP